jgi:AraC-like DNA-binding protein
MLALLRAAVDIGQVRPGPSIATQRLIHRTKEYFGTAFTKSLLASDIAKRVGTTSTYLTDVFTRFEGIFAATLRHPAAPCAPSLKFPGQAISRA